MERRSGSIDKKFVFRMALWPSIQPFKVNIFNKNPLIIMKVNSYLKCIVLCCAFGMGYSAMKAQTLDDKIRHNQMISDYDQWKQNEVQETQKAIQDPTYPAYTNEQDYGIQKAAWIAQNPDAYDAAVTGIPASTIQRIEKGRGSKTYIIMVNRGIDVALGNYFTNKLQGQAGVVNVYVDSQANRAIVTLKDEYAENILKNVFNITL